MHPPRLFFFSPFTPPSLLTHIHPTFHPFTCVVPYRHHSVLPPATVQKILVMDSYILRRNVAVVRYNVRIVQEVLKISDEELATMCSRFPLVLGHMSPQKYRRLHAVVVDELGWQKEDLRELLIRQPQTMITINPETFVKKIRYLGGALGLDDRATHALVRTAPAILGRPIGFVEKRVQFMVSLGFTREQTLVMLHRMPSLMLYAESNLADKVTLVASWGVGPEDIFMCPSLLGYSTERIQGRFGFARERGHEIRTNMLVVSEFRFLKRVGATEEDLALWCRETGQAYVARKKLAPEEEAALRESIEKKRGRPSAALGDEGTRPSRLRRPNATGESDHVSESEAMAAEAAAGRGDRPVEATAEGRCSED